MNLAGARAGALIILGTQLCYFLSKIAGGYVVLCSEPNFNKVARQH